MIYGPVNDGMVYGEEDTLMSFIRSDEQDIVKW